MNVCFKCSNCDTYIIGKKPCVVEVTTMKSKHELLLCESCKEYMGYSERAISTWGEDSQIDVAIGELAELIDVIIKERRNQKKIIDVVHEIVDAQICLDQLKLIYGTKEDYDNIWIHSIARLEMKLSNPEKYRFK